MRIAMMTNNYKPFVGGVPISIERLADSLRDLGHSVYVFAPDYKSPVDDDEYTFRFPTMKHKIAGAIPIPNLIYGYVKNAISTLDIDLIHVHHPVMIGNVATRIGKEFHIPVVFTYHTRYEQYLHYLTPFGYLQNKANQGNLLGESILDFAQRQVIQRYLNRFLEKCDTGEVWIDNECITNMNEEDLSAFRRRKIGFIFQAFNLVPSLNVWENIILPIGLDDRKPDMVYLKEIIELLGLSEKLNNLPNTLSGGQQQRVAIARALATKPAIVLADEPTGNLDSKTSDEVMALLKTSAMKYEQTLIVITHNEDIAQMGNRKLVITDGKVVEQ